MLIAEAADVARAHPGVPQQAIDHLLHALHRAVPLLQAGRSDTGLRQLRADLAAYPGPYDDFERLGVRAIFTAAGHGRHACANTLGELRLLARDRARPCYVLIGDILAARLWARNRGIGAAQVVVIRGAGDAPRTLGLHAPSTVVVYLDDRPIPAGLDAALQILIDSGAVVRSQAWRPGADPDAGRPLLAV